jgi:PAS domain S-box-containing protein
MPSIPVSLQSASDTIEFALGLIALLQAGVAWTTRERGMLWFAAGSLLTTVLVALGGTAQAVDLTPSSQSLVAMYAVRDLLVLGLTSYLGMQGRRRTLAVLVLVLPSVLFAAAMLNGFSPARPQVAGPLLWADLGMCALCLVAGRRQPGVGHDLLAVAPLIGPAIVLLGPWRGPGPHLNHDFPATVICFGVVILVVGLQRHNRASRQAQALAQRMSDFYAALSHTNQAILRIGDVQALCDEICRICVRWGHVRLACVYQREGQVAHRVAAHGPSAGLFAGQPASLDLDGPQLKGTYTAAVLLEGRRTIAEDYQTDPRSARWHDLATEHGVRSMAWLPLRRDGQVVAVLMLAAGQKGFFTEALVALLDEMTMDISFAFDNIARDARHAQATQEVHAGLERFSRLFESAPVASAIISVDGRIIVDANQLMCEQHGMAREEIVGQTTAALRWIARSEGREEFYRKLAADGRVRTFPMQLHHADGRVRDTLMNAETIDYLGQRCFLFMSLDITELRAAQEAHQALAEAQAASRAKTQFLSTMSHELRTPLNAVLGFSSLLRHEAAGQLSAQQLAQLDHVQQAGWHLLRLINDVLDLSRIEAGQFGISARGLALSPVLDEAVQMSQLLAQRNGIALEPLYRQLPPLLALADPTRLRQVLLNVLSNAIKYGRPRGTVQVRTFRSGDSAAIEVADDGLGMSAQQLQHLFEPFNRLGREGQGIEGSGIGLAVTRQLMQLMNGEVSISSEENVGTRVVLTLPLTDTVAPEPAGAAPLPLPTIAPRGSVLYIEDNEVNALLVEQLLARWGEVRFVGARDGATGLRMAETLKPDLVLLDLQLPDIDGLDVLGRLRADASLDGMPIVVLSATAMPADIAQARDRGATDYWTKPLDFQHFLAGIATLLGQARA